MKMFNCINAAKILFKQLSISCVTLANIVCVASFIESLAVACKMILKSKQPPPQLYTQHQEAAVTWEITQSLEASKFNYCLP